MTLAHVAAFAESDSGGIYLSVCDRFGIDPGAIFEDEFIAYQMRLALIVAHGEAAPSESPEDPHAAFERARAAGAELRREMG